ncbi:MAG: DUF1684 domain-containing protein [Candidatus Kariarchaeaceae archaeon]|jgi:uncharacterized protein (DUF1684 family)
MSYSAQIQRDRTDKDRFFEKSPHSPLSHHLRHNFQGLEYYPVSEDYRFELPLVPHDEIETVEMDTSDGKIKYFDRVGYLEFDSGAGPTKIQVYQSHQNRQNYFIPFRDKTSGKETYGAGRYLDVESHGGVFELDFNKAYNPMCAYSDAYSCPFPPMENWLEVPIEAGEKNFTQ